MTDSVPLRVADRTTLDALLKDCAETATDALTQIADDPVPSTFSYEWRRIAAAAALGSAVGVELEQRDQDGIE